MWAEVVIKCKKDLPREYISEWFGEGDNVEEALHGTDFEDLITHSSAAKRVVHAQVDGTMVFALIQVSNREIRLHVQDRYNKASLKHLKERLEERVMSLRDLLDKHGIKIRDIKATVYAEGEFLAMWRVPRWESRLAHLLFKENIALEILTPTFLLLATIIGGKPVDRVSVYQVIAVLLAFVIVLSYRSWRDTKRIELDC